MANGFLIGIGMTPANIDAHHDHAGRAETALQSVMFAESFLHRVQCAISRGKSLDGDDILALRLHGKHGAALHRFAIDMDSAATALRCIATDMRPCQAQMIADEINQQRARFDLS
jgi:hypothetical protein